jgi:hypothetical protein
MAHEARENFSPPDCDLWQPGIKIANRASMSEWFERESQLSVTLAGVRASASDMKWRRGSRCAREIWDQRDDAISQNWTFSERRPRRCATKTYLDEDPIARARARPRHVRGMCVKGGPYPPLFLEIVHETDA